MDTNFSELDPAGSQHSRNQHLHPRSTMAANRDDLRGTLRRRYWSRIIPQHVQITQSDAPIFGASLPSRREPVDYGISEFVMPRFSAFEGDLDNGLRVSQTFMIAADDCHQFTTITVVNDRDAEIEVEFLDRSEQLAGSQGARHSPSHSGTIQRRHLPTTLDMLKRQSSIILPQPAWQPPKRRSLN